MTFLALLAAYAVIAPSARAQTTEVWMVKQHHIVNGNLVFYISPNALRMDNVDAKYSMIANAKDGMIYFFNDSTHRLYKSPLKHFIYLQQKLIGTFINEKDSALQHWQKDPQSVNVGKLRATQFKASGHYTSFVEGQAGGYLKGNKRAVFVSQFIFLSRDIPISKELLHVYCEIQDLPELGGLPLRQLNMVDKRNNVRCVLDTSDAKPMKIPANNFKVPQTYKQTKMVGEVTNEDTTGAEALLGF